MADLSDAIEAAATAPKSAEADGVKVEATPLPDLIAADKHLQASAGASRKTRGIRYTKLVPPGAS